MNVALFDCRTCRRKTTLRLEEPWSVCINRLVNRSYKVSFGDTEIAFRVWSHSVFLFFFRFSSYGFIISLVSFQLLSTASCGGACLVVHASLEVCDIPLLSVRWSTEPSSVRISVTSWAVFILTMAVVHWSLLPLITASVFQSRWREKYIFSMQNEESYYSTLLTTNQFHYSVFCLQLEEMLNRMSNITQACESGCQSFSADILWIGVKASICDSFVCTLPPTP